MSVDGGSAGGELAADLRAARDRLSMHAQMLDAVGEAVIAAHLDGIVFYWNTAAEELYGYPRDEAVGRPIGELTVAEASADQAGEIMAAVAAGQPWTGEFTVRDRTGRVFPARVTDAPIRGADGEIVGIIGISRDISAEARAQAVIRESEGLFRRIFDESPVGKLMVGPDLRVRRVNGALCAMLGYASDELVGRPYRELTHPDDTSPDGEVTARFFDGTSGTYRAERYLRNKSGARVDVTVTAALVRDDRGVPRDGVAVIEDHTATRRAEEARREVDQANRMVIETAVDAFVGIDAAGLVTDWNPAAEQMFGWSAEEILGAPLAERIIPASFRAAHLAAVQARLATGATSPSTIRRELTARHRAGHVFPVELAATAVSEQGEIRFKAFIRDITDRKRYEAELARRAVTDPLTGLANRALFLDRLTSALERLNRRNGTVAVLFIDLDRFKVINDSLGHAAGDRLLAILGDRMRGVLRPADTLARFGGDEFVLVCEDLDGGRDAGALADRLLAVLGAKAVLDGREMVVDASIGIALASSPGVGAEELVRDADAAMYRAKRRSGGAWELFDEGLRAHAVARLELERELRDALHRGELRVFYQPVVDLDERPVAAEALVRWQHPVRGIVPPVEFIPLSEQTGLIVPLGKYVLEEACRQLAEWHRDPATAHLQIKVNLSARQLADPGLPRWVEELLARHGLTPSSLCLEITESVLLDESGTPAEALQALHAHGVQLAVDDFGTGHSSLLSLRRFPVQVLKLDRSFVSGLGRNDSDTAIVGSVIGLAHSLGLTAVAEGVETREQLEKLRSFGCDLAQGFLWSRPVPAEEAADLLRARAGNGRAATVVR